MVKRLFPKKIKPQKTRKYNAKAKGHEEMIGIKSSKINKNTLQIFKIEGSEIVASDITRLNKCNKVVRQRMPLTIRKGVELFLKIVKYKTDVCTLCEIIQDNVLKR